MTTTKGFRRVLNKNVSKSIIIKDIKTNIRPEEMIWMACYHDTNSMNEEQEETTFTPIFSI